ncbi:MAG: T9SS type A sorting domain-containing protein [Janthinobacterium lividum]
MKHPDFLKCLAGFRAMLVLAALSLPGVAPSQAQAPAWGGVAPATNQVTGAGIEAVATDASGNVFVAGGFSGQITFGSTVLTGASGDVFVAKYVPGTNTWAWAQRIGGTGVDRCSGIAVSGSSVYVTGSIYNDYTNLKGVLVGGTSPATGTVAQAGASQSYSDDLFVAKFVDQGSSAIVAWSQVAGGAYDDMPGGIAVSGNSVYITGTLYNNRSNVGRAVFGGAGLTVGTIAQVGVSAGSSLDLVLAKYTDNGSTATFNWSQVGGGDGTDEGTGVAVSGTSVYVTGTFSNNLTNSQGVLFGGSGSTSGTVPANGTSILNSLDLVLAKYTDNGSSATLRWTQVAGGTNYDQGNALAVSGSNVYVTGFITNSLANTNAVVFGGNGIAAGTVQQNGASSASSKDLVLAKYVDNGATATLGWTQVGGGSSDDAGRALAVSGNSVYLTGGYLSNKANADAVFFGGSGTTAGTVPVYGVDAQSSVDLLVAKYTDGGTSATLAWTQVGGGHYDDYGFGVALSGQRVCVGGSVTPPAAFGSYAISTASPLANVLAYLTDSSLTPLSVQRVIPAGVQLAVFPSPTPGAATLSGATPSTAVQVLDSLGRVVATATADAVGTATLPSGLAPGVYVVRSGTHAKQLVVE